MDTQQQIDFLKNELEELRFLVNRKLGGGSADIKGRIVAPSTVGATVALNAGDISSSTFFAAAVVDQTAIGANAVGDSELKDELVTLAFGSGDTTQNATITSGSVIAGIYSSTVTSTPAYGELQLSISGTTLTGTRSAAPGGAAAITYSVRLIKT